MFNRLTFDSQTYSPPPVDELTLFVCREHHCLFRSSEAARAHARCEHGRSTAYYTDDATAGEAKPDLLVVPAAFLDEYVQDNYPEADLAASEFPLLLTDDAHGNWEFTVRHPFTGQATETISYSDAEKHTIVDARCRDARAATTLADAIEHPTALSPSEI